MLILFLFVNFLNVPAFASLLLNVAILKGEQLSLQCTIEFSSKFLGWHFVQVGSNSEKPVTTSSNELTHDYQGRAGVYDKNNSSQLTIRSVQLSDAGVFGCKSLINSGTTHQRAHVVVLDGNVRLLRQNSSHISCEIVYNGNWTPELRLSATDAGKGAAMLNASEIRYINQSNGNRKVIVVMETSSFSFNHTTYSCQLQFTNRSLAFEASHVASNIPSYRDNAYCKENVIHDTCSMEDISESTTTNPISSVPFSFAGIISISVVVSAFVPIVAVITILYRMRKLQAATEQINDGENNMEELPDRLSVCISEQQEDLVIIGSVYEGMQPRDVLASTQQETNYVRLHDTRGQTSNWTPSEGQGRRPSYTNVIVEVLQENSRNEESENKDDTSDNVFPVQRFAYTNVVIEETERQTQDDTSTGNRENTRGRRPAYTNVTIDDGDVSKFHASSANLTQLSYENVEHKRKKIRREK